MSIHSFFWGGVLKEIVGDNSCKPKRLYPVVFEPLEPKIRAETLTGNANPKTLRPTCQSCRLNIQAQSAAALGTGIAAGAMEHLSQEPLI